MQSWSPKLLLITFTTRYKAKGTEQLQLSKGQLTSTINSQWGLQYASLHAVSYISTKIFCFRYYLKMFCSAPLKKQTSANFSTVGTNCWLKL